MKRKLLALGAAIAVAFTLTACDYRQVDVAQTNAQPVVGANGLHYFCHGPTLIYFSKWDTAPDEYEAMWPGWCMFDPTTNAWVYDPAKLKDVPAARTDGNVQEDANDK
jgi:hypothetical protein